MRVHLSCATVSGYGGCILRTVDTILVNLCSFGGKPKIGKLIGLMTDHLCIHPRFDSQGLGDVQPQILQAYTILYNARQP
jgi:hypothetical protein